MRFAVGFNPHPVVHTVEIISRGTSVIDRSRRPVRVQALAMAAGQ
jgi:hypothetical protein